MCRTRMCVCLFSVLNIKNNFFETIFSFLRIICMIQLVYVPVILGARVRSDACGAWRALSGAA